MRKSKSLFAPFLVSMFCLLSTYAAMAQTTLSAASLSFGSLAVGVQSSSQSVTFTNTSGATIAISSIALTGADASSFVFANSCGTSLAAGANCTIHGHFTPAVQGQLTAAVTVTDSATNSPQSIALSGTGLLTPPTLSATSLSFGSQLFGTASASQSVTLTNTGTAPLAISSISVTGANASSFVFSNTCGTSVAVAANCTIHGTLTPAATGALTATVTIVDDASNSPQSIALTGSGFIPAPTLSATSLSFGSLAVGATSNSQSVTITNTSTAPIAISSFTVTGPGASSFVFASSCGTSLAGGANCTIHGHFAPTAQGPVTATATITDDANGSPQTIALSGTGLVSAPTLSATSLTFGNQLLGTPSASQSVTLTNTGTAPLAISSIAVSGAGASSFAVTNTCGTSVAVGGNCTIKAIFTPGVVGALAATVKIIDDASSSPQTITLGGTGYVPAPTLSATSMSFGDLTVGVVSNAQSVTFTNTSTVPLAISSIALTGANPADFLTSNTCGTSLAAGGNCTIKARFVPAVQGPLSASITITDDATGSPQSIALSGTGFVTAPTLSTTQLTFGNQVLATASASQSATLTNTGTAPLAISSITVSGSGASSFTVTNTCGSSVAVGGSCTIKGVFTPTVVGALAATVTIVDDASNSPQTIALSGTGYVPAPTLSATSLLFGNLAVATTSGAQSVTFTNNSAAPIAISSIALTGANPSDFLTSNTCGTSLAAGANCTIKARFVPAAQGPLAASITITDDANGSPQTIALSGTGIIAAPTLSATSLSFGNQLLGLSSAAQSVTLTNNAAAPLAITSVTVSGAGASSFAVTNTCGSSVAVGGSCTVKGVFTPTVVGALAATVTIVDDATNTPQTIALSGTGYVPAPTLSATSLSFGSLAVGVQSNSQSVTLTNAGTVPLAISSIAVTGANASSFVFSNTCGTSLAAGANCTIHGHFTPAAPGALTAAVTLTDDAVNSPQSIALSGTGIVTAPTLSATNLAFGSQVVGTTSASQSVTLTNTSAAPLAISGITVSGANAASFTFGNTCGSSVAAGSSCTISGTFAPTVVSAQSATITITDDAVNSPQSIQLTGVGTGVTTVTLSAPSVAFGNQVVGTTSPSQSVTLSNTGAVAMTINSISVTGTNASSFSFSNTCGTSLAAGANCTISGTFKPLTLGAQIAAVTIVDNGDLSPQGFTLSGTGVNPAPTLSASTIAFGNELFGQSTGSQSVTFTNTSALPLAISSIAVTGADASSFVIANTCGTSVAAGGNCTIHGHFTPAALGALTASVTITDNAVNSPQSIALTGTGYIPPPTLSASSLTFPSTAVGSTSASQQVTLTNTGGTVLSIASIAVTGTNASSFVSTNNCGSNLPAGGSCAIQGEFAPTATGTLTAAITITDNASSTTQTVALSGSAFNPPIASLSANAIAFGNVTVGSSSGSQSVTLTNTGGAALSITSISVSGVDASSFVIANSCGTSLAAGANCTIHGHFTPATTGGLSATVTIVDNAGNSPQSIALTGTGLVPGGSTIFLGPASIAFGAQVLSTPSATQTVTLNNTTATALSLTSVVFGGPFSLDTSAVTTCPTSGGSLPGNSTCIIGIKFTPSTLGPTTGGQITVIDTASNSPQFTTLSGTGVPAVSLSTATAAFGNQTVNTTSAAQTVTLTNNQSSALNFTSFGIAAPYAIATAGTTCKVGTPVAANGGACNISLTFAPTLAGPAATASLSINDNAPSSPQSVNLTGTGVAAVTLNPTALSYGTVVLHEATVQSLTLTNNLATPLTISSITGLTGGYALNGPGTNCPLSPLTLAAGQSCAIAVSLTATATGSQPGTMTITDNAPGSPQSVALSGNAIVPVVLSPASLTFAAQYIGTSSTAQTVTLTNNQNVGLNISSIAIAGADPSDFSVTSSCATVPTPVPANTNCPINVAFKPTASGTRTATLTVADDAQGSPQTISLTGAGNAPVTVSPTSITNYTAPVGTTSTYQTITITNSSTALVHIASFALSGDFVQTSTTCPIAPTALAVGASCNLTVSFDPTIGGTRGGQVQINDDTPTSPQVVNLQGSGTSPLTLSTSSLSFSALLVGTVSPAQAITLTNHESKVETFTLTPTGDFTANSNCPTGIIAAQTSCLLYVNFTPSSTNPTTRNGSLTVTHSAAVGSPLVASLTGSATATNPPAAVSVVAPGAGAAGTAVNVAITGNGWTHFTASSVITFVQTVTPANACSLTVGNQVLVSPNQINAQLTISGSPIYGACNISVASPLSGGGTETATLLSAFTIAEASNAHNITVVNPAFGTQGQTLNVNLTATGTHFVQGTTFANFGDGISINSLTITDSTDAQANITISNTTYIGYRTITMMTGGEFATSNSTAFQIGPNNATLVSVSPNTEPQNGVQPVTLTTTGTHFLPNATQVSIGGVLVGDVIVNSPTSATAQVAVSATAIGPQNVTVWTGGEIATLPNAFTITGATPALLSVAPGTGIQGQQNENILITGNAFTTFSQANIQAEFDGNITVNSITVHSPSSVTVNISISSVANVGPITANLISGPAGSATLFPFTFTVTPSAAAIVSVVPNSVPQGGQVTLNVTGINTIWNQPQTMAAFYPVPVPEPYVNEVTINSQTSAQLAISVPTNTPPGTYGFYIATGGQIVSASINVYAQTPTLTMNPPNGLLPAVNASNQFTVNFTGQFTHFGPTTLPVIAGEGVNLSNFVVHSPVTATGTITILGGVNGTPTATGSRLVTFTTGGEIVTTNFNVTQTPVAIYEVIPYHAPQNTTLNVEIVGLNTHFTSTGSSPTQVIFGGPQITVNSVTVNSATDLIANITTSYVYNGVTTASPPGWQNVYVNTGAEQVIGGFAVDPPASPIVLSVVPGSAAQGSTVNVTITGSATHWVSGTTDAILGEGVTVSNLVITSPTTATATIAVSPTAPIGGQSVIMVTGTEYDSGAGFSVTPDSALIQSVEPNFSCPATTEFNVAGFGCPNGGGTPTGIPVIAQLQTITLNIVGVGTHWLQGETQASFGFGVSVDQLTVTSPTTAAAQITVLSTSPVGFAALTMTTDGEVVTLQQAIDIEEGSPILLAISPTGAQQGATLNVTVLGRFTNFTQGVTSAAFNQDFPQDITVNSINVIDSETLVANVTVGPWSIVDYGYPCGHGITITTGSQQVGGLPGNFCVTQGAEEITNVTPLDGVQGTTETVTITGSDTNFLPGVTQVSFGDPNFHVGQITVNSSTSLTVPVAITTSATTGFKTVTVTTYGQIAQQQYSFTVIPGVATLNEAIPDQLEQGVQTQVVRLIGQYSHFSSSSTATFGAGITVNSIAYVSPTEVDATISIDPLSYVGGRSVTVTTPGVPCSYQPPFNVTGLQYAGCTPGVTTGTGSEIVTNSVFTIIPGPAIISSVAPNTGNEGQEVVFNISGSATHWAQNFTQFYIAGGGSDLTINSVVINSPTSATVDMSISPTANPGARSIYMVTNGESLTDSGAFVVTGGVPVITYLSPNNALIGASQVEVTINGLYTQWSQGNTTVNFGPGVTVTNFTVDDATHITAVVNIAANAQAGYRTVFVQTGTQGLTSNFLVQSPPPPPTPYIWWENPSSGLPGQTFTIQFFGAYTQWQPGSGGACSQSGTTLTGFNASVTVNCFQVLSATSATANITISPTATASTSDLTFTTGSEVENAQFNVVIDQPRLSIVDPGSGMQGAQNLTVNIIGQYTTFDSTTTFSFGPDITTVGAPTILGPTIATQVISINQLAPLGGSQVVATTTDTPGGSQVVGGAYFDVSPSLALISAVTPNSSKQGTTASVEVTGQNTHWDGSTTFHFGAGIVVTSVTVNSNTDATLTIVVPALAPEGPTNVSAQTGGEDAYQNNGFVVQAGTPLLLSSGPGSAPQQGSVVFTILSQATNWTSANPPVVSYGPGITLTNTTVTGPTSLTVDGYVIPTTPVGYYNLTVSTGAQTLGIQNAVYVSPGPAVINNLSPNTGGQNANLPAVQINGTNTHWVQGTTQLTFPNVLINSYTVNSPTSITANITVNSNATPGQVTVTATTLGEIATGVNVFTITQTQPELLSVVPTSGAQGLTTSPVNLTGDFTSWVNGTTTANFGAGITVNSVTVSSPTAAVANITVSPTATLGARTVSVTTGAQVVSLTNAYTVTVGPAAIAGPLVPATGGQGQALNIAITGSQTHWVQGTTTAQFGGGIQVTSVTINSLTSATVGISIPNGTALASYTVSLTTGGEVASILNGFSVTTGAPQISAVSPPTGTQGTTFNVNLTGLYTHWVQGTSAASFGSGITVNSLTVSSATAAVANITISQTATIASRNVTVTTTSEVATLTGGFSVLAGVPALLTDLPGSAQAGTTANIVITGEFTSFQQGFSTVSFGSGVTVNFVTVSSTTQLTANITVASNATVGTRTINVTTNSQSVSLNNGFTVTAGTPVITQINPNYGNPGQTLNVTIYGQYTLWSSSTTVSFGAGITVNTVTENSPTQLTVNITIGAATSPGPFDVQTTTGGEMETVPGGFTVQPVSVPAPTLISLSPGPNAGGVPINSSFIGVFSQPMNRTTITTSTVTLTLTSNPNGQVSVPGTVNVDAAGRVVTFTPNSLLAPNSTYYLNLTGAIQSATGTAFSYYNVPLYTEFTANATQPTVVAANPPANATNVGTNVTVQLEFTTDMDQNTASGLVVATGGNPVPGTWTWNSYPYGSPYWGPGTVAYFTPTAALSPATVYTVSYNATTTDTAGNALIPGSFSFTTGAAADTTTNNVSALNYQNNQTNVGTNFVPAVQYQKPINPLDINTGTLLLYNADSGKYIAGTVTVATNGLGATFAPTYPLLPQTYYHFHQACGDYDMDAAYLNCGDWYFTTGAGTDLTAPTVASISPANNATSVPLNAEVVVHFSSSVSPSTGASVITVTPSGGSAISGTATLSSDLVTFTFVPASPLVGGKQYTVQVSGYEDVVGNVGTTFSSTFTAAASPTVINVSTGLNSAGQRITTNNTNDANWTYVPVANLPGQGTEPLYAFSAGTNATGPAAALQTIGTGDAGFYGGWPVNGPSSDWIAINPNSVAGNTLGVYSTTFNIPGPTVPANLCLVGSLGIDDNGELGINGNAITGNISAITGLAALNVAIPAADLVVGSNTLSLGWGSTDNSDEAFRLTGVLETCGASETGGLTVTSSTPSNGATGVATNSTITINFSNPLDPATVNSNTLRILYGYNGNNQIAGTYQVNGNQVIFTPDAPFAINNQIYVTAYYGPYDLAGDAAGGNYTQLFNFTTGGTATAPPAPFQVLAFTPAQNATNVGLRAPVTATFNRSFNPNTINSSNNPDFELFAGGGQAPWCGGGSYNKSQDNTTISFNCYPLISDTILTAELNSGLTDWAGNALVPFTSQFTTSLWDANTNGSVITSRPGNSASGIPVNEPITIYTNYPVNPSTATNGFQVAQNNVAVPGSVAVLDGGYTLEFTPSTNWTPGALIQWWTTGLYDTTYNTPINNASGYFYVAVTTGTLTPTVQVASPAPYSKITPNVIFDVQFNTPLSPATITTSTIYLWDNTTSLLVPATYSEPQPNEVRMVPTSDLSAGHTVSLYINAGLQSATSVPAAVNSWYYSNIVGPDDTSLPTVLSAVPYNSSTGVGVNVTPDIVTSKPMDPVSVNSTTFQVTNGGTPLAGTFYLNSTDTRIGFVPNAPLPANTNLVMKVNGLLDLEGHPLTSTTSFTTGNGPDFVQPTVIWSSVASNESIPTNSMIEVRFSEPMDITTFANGQPGACGNFYMEDVLSGDGNPCIATTLTWSADQTTAYLTPTQPLAAGRQYYFAVNNGTDLAGNGMQNISFYFYAELGGASTAPTVVAFNPLSGATGTGTNTIIEAQFNNPIDPTSIANVILTQGATTISTTPVVSTGNTVIQLVPWAPLAPNTTYTMHIAGVKDPAGNLVATITNSFTTGTTFDLTALAVVSSDPAYNTTVGINVNPKFVFNKPLNPITVNSGSFYIRLTDTNQNLPSNVTLSANGLEVTITPLTPLLPNTRYQFAGGGNGGPQDEDGNYLNTSWYYFNTNGGADNSGPTVTISPVNAATGVPLNAQITATLSAIIDPTTITQSSVVVEQSGTPIAGTVTEPTNTELVFTPTSALTASTTYTVQVTGITDANGNAVAANSSSFTTGTVTATGGLTLTSYSVTSGQNVTNNVLPITLTFSQVLNPATVVNGNLLVTNSQNTNWGIAGTWTINPSNGAQVTFTPSNPYPPNATIWMYITTALKDDAGDSYSSSVWPFNFTTNGDTPDTTPLTVLSVSPASGATNVRPDVPVSVTFNKGINPYSIYNTSNNALLFAGQGLQDRGSITMSADNRTMTFSSGVLYTNAAYTIDLPAGGISDPSGNTLATTFVSTFTTGGNPAAGNGSVQSTEPGNVTGVPTDSGLTLFMNRQVNASTVPGQLSVTVNGSVYAGTVQSAADGYEIQFTPTVPFPNGAAVQWFLSGSVQDVGGNDFNGDSGYFYTAAAVNAATAAPTVIAVSPESSSNTVPINAEIDIEYNLPIDPATVNTSDVYFNTGTAASVSVLAAPNNNIIRIVPNANLAPGGYYVCANASVKGTNGVATPGGCWTINNFTVPATATTADTTPGTVILGPPNGSASVGTNAYIRFWLSKPIDVTSVNTTTVAITAGGNPVPGTWGYNYSGNDVREINFSPVNPLPPSTAITVAVNGLLDYAGNHFTPVTSNFTTAALPDYTTPTVSFDFGDNTQGIGTNASFTCLYSEPMDPGSVNPSNTAIYSYITNATIPFTYTWASDLMSVTMKPTTPLFANSEYNYSCEGAINLTGNGESGTYIYFYTGNGPTTTGPTLVYANPPSGTTNVPLNSIGGPWNNTSLMLLFSEPVSTDSMANITFTPQGGSAEPIAVYPEYGNQIADVQLPWAMAPNTTYTFNVAGVTDLNGNPASGTTTSSFTTGSSFNWADPTATAATPANGTTVTGVSPVISLTFSTLMNPVLITSSQLYLRTHNTQTTIPTTLAISTVGGVTVVTLTPTAPLAESTIYDLYYYPNNWWLYDIAGNIENQYGIETTFTTGTTAAVNGACGSANTQSFSTVPSTNLCSAGTASAVTNPGSWTWSCNGQYGGTNASCSATVTGTPACSAQLSSLQGLWPGTDNTTDYSPNAYNGTLENGVTYSLGVVGDAFNLEGNATNLDQFVSIGSTVPTNLQIQNAITLSAWIYPTQLPTNYGSGALGLIVGSQHDGTTSGATIFFDGNTNSQGIVGIPPGHIQFQIGNGSWHEYDTTTQLPLNQWTLITATRTANNPAQIYYNGVLQPSVTSESAWNGTVTYSGSWFAIGQQSDYNRPFVGLINDVQAYDAALTQSQVTAIYNAAAGGVCQ